MMKAQFERADADRSGKLDPTEFKPIVLETVLALRAAVSGWEATPTTADFAGCYERCDADGDGQLDLFGVRPARQSGA